MKRILIIEDDPVIVQGLEIILQDEPYEILAARDGEQGYLLAQRENIDLIVLDILLPKKNGLDICRQLRQEGNGVPILMLTSKREELDQVLGLELGADDYVTKPFSNNIIKARIKKLLERLVDRDKQVIDYTFGDIHLDFKRQEAMKDGQPLKLTSMEFNIMHYLIQHEGEVITRVMLLDDVWGYTEKENIPTTRTVDNYILSLRKKLEDDPSNPKHLLTIHTSGYKFMK